MELDEDEIEEENTIIETETLEIQIPILPIEKSKTGKAKKPKLTINT